MGSGARCLRLQSVSTQPRGFGSYWLLLKGPRVRDQRFDLVVIKALGGFHPDFVAVFDASLHGLEGLFLLKFCLPFSVGHIFDFGFFAQLRFALAIGAMTLRAALFPVFFYIRRRCRYQAGSEDCESEAYGSFHKVLSMLC